ncbi:hypothetical protein BDV34DRAFT_115569 [Aspergillus parasiticus]|uniref:Uncharacterized protein n=1 Tax=Aspergillus parasiticus TaxID=5067 RepID=A0A5N6DIY8_ASPPA|nr:hypothetical protein BDV34DRAFT_115569 [Aspergillus parasiticus]
MTDDLAWVATAMCALLRRLMVRWTMASSLPIGNNRTIEKDISPAKKKILYCPMTDEEGEAYKTYWAKNSRVMTLDRSEPGNPKYTWNMEKLRKLVMGSSWLAFIALEKNVIAKSIPKALNALRRNILMPKFLSALEAVSDERAVCLCRAERSRNRRSHAT